MRVVSTSSPRAALRGEAEEPKVLAFAPDIAAAGESGVIRLFDVLTGEKLLTLEGHATKIHDLAFAPDGSILASCSHDGAVCLWRAVSTGAAAER